MTKRNITHAGEIAKRHEQVASVPLATDISYSERDEALQKVRVEAALQIYRSYFARKQMNSKDGLSLVVQSGRFSDTTYVDAAVPPRPKHVGKVYCNDRVPALFDTDKDENVQRPVLENTTMNSLAEKLTALGHILTGYGAGIEVIALLDRTAHFYTWEDGDYLFPGALMTNGNGEWCVPEIRIREDLTAMHGKRVETHIIPLTARPKTVKHVVWIQKNTKK